MRQVFEPAADGYKIDGILAVKELLSFPDFAGEIGGRGSFLEQRAITTTLCEMAAVACVMADTGEIPHVVHSPNYFFAHRGNTRHAVEREEGLVDPTDKDGIRLPDERMAPKRKTGLACIYLKERGSVKTVFYEDRETLG